MVTSKSTEDFSKVNLQEKKMNQARYQAGKLVMFWQLGIQIPETFSVDPEIQKMAETRYEFVEHERMPLYILAGIAAGGAPVIEKYITKTEDFWTDEFGWKKYPELSKAYDCVAQFCSLPMVFCKQELLTRFYEAKYLLGIHHLKVMEIFNLLMEKETIYDSDIESIFNSWGKPERYKHLLHEGHYGKEVLEKLPKLQVSGDGTLELRLDV